MRKIDMNDPLWARLLAMRGGRQRRALDEETEPAIALYGPIAAARAGFVLAQVGQSLDGRVATPAGDARDISGPDGIAHLHRCRALVEAVIVGVGTVKADNPRLSVRAVKGPNPVRVVIDCRGELTGDEGMFCDGGAPVLLIQGEHAPRRRYSAEQLRVRQSPSGLDPREILDAQNSFAFGKAHPGLIHGRYLMFSQSAACIASWSRAGHAPLPASSMPVSLIGFMCRSRR
jgi:diaminohydroxyphosphoribosylaminopyrimidine deaminase / 5-amino-6-(5-phosphoribosylamino)uracil reductase